MKPFYAHIQIDRDAPGNAPGTSNITRVSFPLQRFDGIAVRELFEMVNDLTDHHPKLLVDTTGVPLVPSGGMGMLITIRKRFMSQGGQLHIVITNPNIKAAFEVANLHRMLSLFDSVDAAVKAFKG